MWTFGNKVTEGQKAIYVHYLMPQIELEVFRNPVSRKYVLNWRSNGETWTKLPSFFPTKTLKVDVRSSLWQGLSFQNLRKNSKLKVTYLNFSKKTWDSWTDHNMMTKYPRKPSSPKVPWSSFTGCVCCLGNHSKIKNFWFLWYSIKFLPQFTFFLNPDEAYCGNNHPGGFQKLFQQFLEPV